MNEDNLVNSLENSNTFENRISAITVHRKIWKYDYRIWKIPIKINFFKWTVFEYVQKFIHVF